ECPAGDLFSNRLGESTDVILKTVKAKIILNVFQGRHKLAFNEVRIRCARLRQTSERIEEVNGFCGVGILPENPGRSAPIDAYFCDISWYRSRRLQRIDQLFRFYVA